MNDPLGEQDEASTPLSPEEREGLIPAYITLRGELNEAEQANILRAEEWVFARQRDVLSETFLNNLHRRMFGRVWRWAGAYRKTGKNVGVDACQIPTEMHRLVVDCRYWIENAVFPEDEMAARFHHRLVWIHSYPNGNGRHARLATDVLLVLLGRPRFSWGRESLTDPGETRARYVSALWDADRHELGPLLAFVRS